MPVFEVTVHVLLTRDYIVKVETDTGNHALQAVEANWDIVFSKQAKRVGQEKYTVTSVTLTGEHE